MLKYLNLHDVQNVLSYLNLDLTRLDKMLVTLFIHNPRMIRVSGHSLFFHSV